MRRGFIGRQLDDSFQMADRSLIIARLKECSAQIAVSLRQVGLLLQGFVQESKGEIVFLFREVDVAKFPRSQIILGSELQFIFKLRLRLFKLVFFPINISQGVMKVWRVRLFFYGLTVFFKRGLR